MTGSLFALSWTLCPVAKALSTCPGRTVQGPWALYLAAQDKCLRTKGTQGGQHLSWTDRYRVQGCFAPQNDRSQPTDRRRVTFAV